MRQRKHYKPIFHFGFNIILNIGELIRKSDKIRNEEFDTWIRAFLDSMDTVFRTVEGRMFEYADDGDDCSVLSCLNETCL